MLKKRVKQQAFTLIEIIIALFIFAILGTLAAIGLHSVIKTHRRIAQVDNRLAKLETTMTLLRRDINQIIDRKSVNSDGYLAPAVQSITQGFEFTRAGLTNPFSLNPRSQMQRVAYIIKNRKLWRLTWIALDRPPNSQPEQKLLLNNITHFTARYIAGNNQKSRFWPPSTGSNLQVSTMQSDLPKAIIITLTLKDWGNMQMIFAVPARGIINATS